MVVVDAEVVVVDAGCAAVVSGDMAVLAGEWRLETSVVVSFSVWVACSVSFVVV